MLTTRSASRVIARITFLACSMIVIWAQNAKPSDVIVVQGAGSSFAAPLYKKWIDEFDVLHRNVTGCWPGHGQVSWGHA